ncbi:MAG: hypothetical protein A2Y20_07720 [Firmicutes bacterium GWF2_51_9]|nr:MAG: hypothetical protein A2Y20_07720 [Firmicutes bacterium GWF2_51_9]OGS58482.1 MAG: hypothetical protein A2Y19_00570 [Firmicutes bacterium GWE2_51_13]
MELSIYNTQLDLIGILDTATEIIWHRVFHTSGDFEIHVPATQEVLSLLKLQHLITKPDTVEFGIIETLLLEQNEEGERLKVAGRFGSSLLDRRILFEAHTFNTTVEEAMRTLVSACCITPDNPDRIFPNLELGSLMGYPETIAFQATYKNLLSTLRLLSETSGLGFRVRFLPQLKKFRFEVVQPLDRSFLQSENPRVLFSNNVDNLLTSTYQERDQESSNLALVGGEGVGEDRTLIVVGSETGMGRREVFVNAKDQRKEEGMTLTEYYQLLAQKGQEALVPTSAVFEGTVRPNENITYKVDYDLGDIITIENSQWEKRIHVRITEITEVDDANGHAIIPVFGQVKSPRVATQDTSDSGGGSSILVNPNQAIVSDGSGNLVASTTTAQEVGFLAGVTSAIQTQLNAFWNLMYPIGALYLSVLATSPSVLFGGTWVQISDKFLLAGGPTYSPGTNGGAASHTHTSAAHTHAIASHSHSSAAHMHSIASHSHSSAAHTHVIPAHNHTLVAGFAMIRGNTGYIYNRQKAVSPAWTESHKNAGAWAASSSSNSAATELGGTTDNTGLTTDATTPGNTGSTALTSDSTTPGNTGSTGLTTDATTPGSTGSTSNLPPYLAVYVWKRTA